VAVLRCRRTDRAGELQGVGLIGMGGGQGRDSDAYEYNGGENIFFHGADFLKIAEQMG
jgi:hypothetical protein